MILNKQIALFRLLRPQQWIKNGFVFAPLLFSGFFHDVTSIYRAVLAFALFCLASSAAYIVNDLVDVERDKKHPTKSQTRPIAAGHVTVAQACLMLGCLYGCLLTAWILMPNVIYVIALYLLLNVAYSTALKKQAVIDIFCVATGFVLRVYAGAQAIAVPVSTWMFITTLCLSLFLASIKRRQEILGASVGTREVLGKYTVQLIDKYAEMSASCALLFYSLFVVTTKPALVVTIPLVVFGIFRYWYIVYQESVGESPTEALIRDKVLAGTVLLWLVVCAYVL
jgi:decaprenyl-phosphate phosphoribosyltransferase